MARSVGMMIGLLLVLTTVGGTAAQDVGTPVPTGCEGAADYAAAIQQLTADLEAQFSDDDLSSWTPDQFEELAATVDAVVIDLAARTPPPAAAAFHDLLIESFTAASQLYRAMGVAGVFAALGFTDTMSQLDADLTAATLSFETTCQIALIDDDEDGVPEIGPGETSPVVVTGDGTPAATNAGTRDDPMPVGTTIQTDDDWQITVLAVTPDATAQIMSENAFNEPPAPGHQFFQVRISATYVGDSSGALGGAYRFSAVGQSAVAYSQWENACGSITDPLADPEVFTGGVIEGNICWSVRAEDVDSLVMYDDQASNEGRVFLALTAGSPEADPAAVATPA